MSFSKQKLPELPYDFSALEPVISGKIMELHYSKHHNAYVTNFNTALDKLQEATAKNDVAGGIACFKALQFNGGGHVNHSIFWTNLAPKDKGGGEAPKGALAQAIARDFGSLEKFIEKFNTLTGAIQGSGWGWLGYCKDKKCLTIATCTNQDPLSTQGSVPLLGVDVWEHAYYLQYENRRPDYLKAIWQIINWKNVEERYQTASA
jgi:Fe-Mn family superoxide dismutase